jgi:hypothetical protein
LPKRSNDFQRLVKLIQQSLAPAGAKVTESAMVDGRSGQREIDILVESSLGMYRMKIAVEAKDHKRPLDVTILEQIASKYRAGDGVAVNQVVVVAAAGFTKAAKEFARDQISNY